MSIFASDTTVTIPIPSDPSHSVTLRKLTGRDIERAQGEHLNATVAGRSPRGWAGIFHASLAKGTATEADAQKALSDPLAGFDRFTIVRAGLKGWTFKKDDTPVPVNDETVSDLDDDALEFFAVEIMRLTKPGLFLTDDERKAAQKNG